MKRTFKVLVFSLLTSLSVTGFSESDVDLVERAPVIFVHGLGVPSFPYEYLIPLKKMFNDNNLELYVAKFPANVKFDQGAKLVAKYIEAVVPHGKYHLVGHSMGGLVSRMVIDKYSVGKRCLSLTTLATPHRGSLLADFVLKYWDALEYKPIISNVLKLFGTNKEILSQLRTTYMNDVFNNSVHDNSHVKYYSMSFYIPNYVFEHTVNPILMLLNELNSRLGHPYNDGLVSLTSQDWGTSLGIMPGDHWSETAPIPFDNKFIYKDVFNVVIKNLNSNF